METIPLEDPSDVGVIPDTIEPINKTTVHRICSGQVVLSLAIAVKELVENAVDAGATSIEVRLKEYGSELVEVCDNGSGVRKENFEALTLKHYTSKLREFSDLESVATLGFRGEALSSLCALANMSVTTRHSTADHAMKVQYDSNGRVVSQAPAAREVGTTVALENLFATLPVRRKEFLKNLKREYGKMCQLLYAYCLVSKGVKFTCTNQTKSTRSTVVSTEGSRSVRENIVNIFGARQMPSLLEVEPIEPEPHILEEYRVTLTPGEPLPFTFHMIVSSAMHGSGRSAADRQFFFINSRPCEPAKVMRLVNDVYRQFNGSQYPFVFLDVQMQRSLVDVNVTPDKRQIFLEKEKLLLAALKSSLLEAFKNCPSTYTETVDFNNRKRKLDGVKGNLLELFKKRSKSGIGVVEALVKMQPSVLCESTAAEAPKSHGDRSEIDAESEVTPTQNLTSLIDTMEESLSETVAETSTVNTGSGVGQGQPFESDVQTGCREDNSSTDRQESDYANVKIKQEIDDEFKACQYTKEFKEPKLVQIEPPAVSRPDAARTQITIRSSMSYLLEAVNSLKRPAKTKKIEVRFRSEIAPSANKTAEQELKRHVTKDMFKRMEIVGQFNLGFIVARLDDDLFIIDQHASDEKYNFEQLQASTVLESQVLVNSKPLELTAANEDLLIENIETFRKNGFKFVIDPNAPATKKVALAAIPMSRNYIFGKDDIDEMLFMLQEDVNNGVVRPSRVRAMFASRACRKSVMVGCPLTKSDMRRLVDHMGDIEQPWNCPHGRPTMRHLLNMKLIQDF